MSVNMSADHRADWPTVQTPPDRTTFIRRFGPVILLAALLVLAALVLTVAIQRANITPPADVNATSSGTGYTITVNCSPFGALVPCVTIRHERPPA